MAFELTGRPRFGVVVWPFNRARACSRRAISASMVWIIADVFMVEIIANRLTTELLTATVPQRFFTLPRISPAAYNYDLPTCHARTMANCARTSMLITSGDSPSNLHRFFRGRDSMKGNEENRCSYLHRILQIGSTLPNPLESEVIEMIPLKPEETLHNYLRRHFEKVSKGSVPIR